MKAIAGILVAVIVVLLFALAVTDGKRSAYKALYEESQAKYRDMADKYWDCRLSKLETKR